VDADDQHYQACAELLEIHPDPLIVPTLVVTEVVYLLGTQLGVPAEMRFLADLASGSFDVEPVHSTDWPAPATPRAWSGATGGRPTTAPPPRPAVPVATGTATRPARAHRPRRTP
jgi:hypothetical protein